MKKTLIASAIASLMLTGTANATSTAGADDANATASVTVVQKLVATANNFGVGTLYVDSTTGDSGTGQNGTVAFAIDSDADNAYGYTVAVAACQDSNSADVTSVTMSYAGAASVSGATTDTSVGADQFTISADMGTDSGAYTCGFSVTADYGL